jgi:hypothetical protein
MSSISGVSFLSGSIAPTGGPGEAKSVVEATLVENNKMASWYQAPLRIPDTRLQFPLGGNVNMTV